MCLSTGMVQAVATGDEVAIASAEAKLAAAKANLAKEAAEAKDAAEVD